MAINVIADVVAADSSMAPAGTVPDTDLHIVLCLFIHDIKSQIARKH